MIDTGISKEELIMRLKLLAKHEDREAAHAGADALLLVYINDEDIMKAFEAGDFCW